MPKITIDFGDGRVVQRTITGNSIHYVLDANGRVIDGIPGLYGPAEFLRLIQADAELANRPTETSENETVLQTWHLKQCDQIARAWKDDLRQIGVVPANVQIDNGTAPVQVGRPPSAKLAAGRAFSKSTIELPIVNTVTANSVQAAPSATTVASQSVWSNDTSIVVLSQGMDDVSWAKIAALHAADAKLDQTSRAVIASKNPNAVAAGRAAIAKTRVENPLVKVIANFGAFDRGWTQFATNTRSIIKFTNGWPRISCLMGNLPWMWMP